MTRPTGHGGRGTVDGARVRGCASARVRGGLAIGLLIGLLGGDGVQHLNAQQQATPIFRTNADLVTIPVFVKGSAGVVGGLRAGDFVLTDNGVPQRIESLETEPLPVDVTLIVETSRAMEGYQDTLGDQIQKIAKLVRPTDRLEVLGIGDYVNVLAPLGPAAAVRIPSPITLDGLSSSNDAIVAALLRQPDPDRRHLIIALTDNIDTMSAVDMRTVRDVAKQSSATLVVAWVTLSIDPDWGPPPTDPTAPPPWTGASERVNRHIRSSSQRTVPKRQQWTPHYTPPPGRNIYAFDLMVEAAELTGGAVHPPGVFTDRSAATIFDKIYAEFRQNYLLRYFPDGVTRDGWHDVTVTVPKVDGLDLRARRGYFVEKASSTAAATPESARPGRAADASVALFATFRAAAERDDAATLHEAALAAAGSGQLVKIVEAFSRAGNLWPQQPQREFVAALALADVAVHSISPDEQRAGIDLLARESILVRGPLGNDAVADRWLDAAARLLQAALRPDFALAVANAAGQHNPSNARLALARAVIADQHTVLPGVMGGRDLSPQAIDQLLALYNTAIAEPSTAIEARIRKGWLLKRLGRAAEAQVAFDFARADASNDAVLNAWLVLVENGYATLNLSLDSPEWLDFWRGDMKLTRSLTSR